MNKVRRANAWLWLTVPIAVLLAIAAGSGVFVSGVYRDNPYMVAQAIGQDCISLALVLPTLLVSGFLAGRGSFRARLVWLGVLVYLVYTYIVAAFDVVFNPLFLVYVALLGCSLYALIGGIVTADLAGIRASFRDGTPVRAFSIYLAVLAVLFYALWLSEIVPALMAGQIPPSVQDDGTPTNPIHVVDMAWILPALAITAVSLWRKRTLAYTLAGALLSYLVLLISAILSMVVFMVWRGQPIVVPQVAIFGILVITSLGMLVWYLKHLQPSCAAATSAGLAATV